jgi:hypothetical protein
VSKIQQKPIERTRQGSKQRSKKKPKCSLVWRIGLSGVPPDSVRCTRKDRLRTLHLRVSQAQSHYNSPDCPVHHQTVSGAPERNGFELASFGKTEGRSAKIHRTVRCASEAMATSRQRSTLTANSAQQYTRQKSEQKDRGAPDCPVCTGLSGANGRPAPTPTDRMTWLAHRTLSGVHRTVRCAHRQQPSPTATYLVGGYKYHPNRPLQSVGVQATFQVI